MATYLIVFVGATVLSALATVLAIRLAPRIGAVDQPAVRKVHSVPTPRIGGIAIFLAMTATVLAAIALDRGIAAAAGKDAVCLAGLFCAATFVLIVGFVDDVRGLRARQKLIAQVVAATALCATGVRIESLGVAGLIHINFGWLSWPLTILWIVGITNSLNLIDGLDGLAAGISAIACTVVAAIALQTQQVAMVVVMLAMLGGLAGFLFFNFSPAKVFLGDSGSLFLGFMLAGASVLSSAKPAAAVGLALPLLAMGVPVFDAMSSVVRRALERRSLFAPDRRHIHHHLMKMGLRQRHVVLVLYGATAISAALGMFMMVTSGAAVVVVFLCVLLLLGLFLRTLGVLRPKGTFDAVRRVMTLSRCAKRDKDLVEAAQLRLRESHSVDAWWQVISETAESMGAVRLAVTRCDGDGAKRTVLCHSCEPQLHGTEAVRLTILLCPRPDGSDLQVEMDVCDGGSLEALGKRLALFGRLIDESAEWITAPECDVRLRISEGYPESDRLVA